MKRLSGLTLLNAILASRSGIWEPGTNTAAGCYAVWSTYYLLNRENSIDIRDLFKTKLQLYVDDNEFSNIITSHFVLALKAISASDAGGL